MDGVLVDTARFHYLSWKRLAEMLSIPFSIEQNEELKGISRADSLEKILKWGKISMDTPRKEELMLLKNNWYLEYIEELTPTEMLPGVAIFLNELKKENIKIGLGSSSKNAIHVLEKLEIIHLFETIIDGNKVTHSKPHPEVFQQGAEELNIVPQDIIVFEDAQSGVKAAIDGGFRCVGLGDKNILSAATVVLPSLHEMTVERLKALVD